MEIQKAKIINTLFLLGFPCFGMGKYFAQTINNSFGQVFAVLPWVMITCFYLVDLLHKKTFHLKIRPLYFLVLLFLISCIGAFYTGLRHGYPALNAINTITLSIVITIIIHTPFILRFYNSENADFQITDLLYWGMTLDIFLNLFGYAAGLRNPVHSIEGRLNFPFGQGFYSLANSVAILNLIIIGKWSMGIMTKGFKIFTALQFIFNFVLMLGFNSRLSIMIFCLSAGLWLLKIVYHYRITFLGSLFTIPLLLNFSDILYQILSAPIFSTILKRVSYEDVTGFNGRRDLWERGLHWISHQGQGFLFGNGYHGYYYIGLVDDLEEFWDKSAINLHLHSSFLEYSTTIGIIGVIPIIILLFSSCKEAIYQARLKRPDGALIGVLFYLIFIFQIDNFLYITNYGALILFSIASGVVVKNYKEASILKIVHAKT